MRTLRNTPANFSRLQRGYDNATPDDYARCRECGAEYPDSRVLDGRGGTRDCPACGANDWEAA